MARILALRVVDRIKEAGNTQKVLSRHSSVIKARLGFHELNTDVCSREGYILLYLKNDERAAQAFMNDLDKIYGIEIKHMQLDDNEAGKPGAIAEGASIAVAGLVVSNRSEVVLEVQNTLTSYGCTIRTRLGINEEDKGDDRGIILLELVGEISEMNRLIQRLGGIDNVATGVISFD